MYGLLQFGRRATFPSNVIVFVGDLGPCWPSTSRSVTPAMRARSPVLRRLASTP